MMEYTKVPRVLKKRIKKHMIQTRGWNRKASPHIRVSGVTPTQVGMFYWVEYPGWSVMGCLLMPRRRKAVEGELRFHN